MGNKFNTLHYCEEKIFLECKSYHFFLPGDYSFKSIFHFFFLILPFFFFNLVFYFILILIFNIFIFLPYLRTF